MERARQSLSNVSMRGSGKDADAEGAKVELPTALVEFLQANGINPSIYSSSLVLNQPRYIRYLSHCYRLSRHLDSLYACRETEFISRLREEFQSEIADVEEELCCKLEQVSWLPHFYSIPSSIKIASSAAYKQGKIYGMDAASGAAVLALEVTNGEHVLDLCAAPGAKHCMLAEVLEDAGTLTGVDISRHRLAACRTLLQKYRLGERSRLFLADGTSFSLLPLRRPTNIYDENVNRINATCSTSEHRTREGTRTFSEWYDKRSQSEYRAYKVPKNAEKNQRDKDRREPEMIFYGKWSGVVGIEKASMFQTATDAKALEEGYDKVLVDAECTHDGSVKHILKFKNWGWNTLEHRMLAANRIVSLSQLQLQLLQNGFKLLRTGGTLIYSTCSLTRAQNEDVIEAFLATTPNAELQEIPMALNWPCREGYLRHTLRFNPVVSNTSGLFIAKISKKNIANII